MLALDRRLSRIVSNASEPLLAQMRLAWWRDELARPAAQRPHGDAVLDAIGVHWAGSEGVLAALVDGWEAMLGEPPLMPSAAKSFANARSIPIAHLAGPYQSDAWLRSHAAATRWAMADASAHVSNSEERQCFVKLGLERAATVGRIPRALRGLAVLEGLALRALRAGGAPLMQGRGAALLAMRLGIFGR